jgi:hypothetical protein
VPAAFQLQAIIHGVFPMLLLTQDAQCLDKINNQGFHINTAFKVNQYLSSQIYELDIDYNLIYTV